MVKRWLISVANRAHRHPSPWVRRPVIVTSVVGLALWTAVFWLAMPILVTVLVIAETARAFGKSIMENGLGIIGQAQSDREDWQRNIPGAINIWRAQKVDPPASQNTPNHRSPS